MSKEKKGPETPAAKVFRAKGVQFRHHVYEYVEYGGKKVSSSALGVDEHIVVKALIMEDEMRKPHVVLMYGDIGKRVGSPDRI